MKAATEFFLTIDKQGYFVVEYISTHASAKVTRRFSSVKDYTDFFTSKRAEAGGTITVMASSTLDFADEYTDKEHVLAMIKAIK